MRLIESSVEYLPQTSGLEGVYKQIELAGRTAYQSQNKITEDSAKAFVEKMTKAKHYATLEHGTVYLNMPYDSVYEENPYSKSSWDGHNMFVTTNYRVLQENEWLDDLKYLCEPTESHERRYTFKFTTDIGVCRELLRHRKFSFLNESTRYCNYSKDKFGGGITFIIPSWDKKATFELDQHLYNAFTAAEVSYLDLLESCATPEQARAVLPLATKTELIMTGFASDWRYLLSLRLEGATGKPHPDMLDLMSKFRDVAQSIGIWDNIMNCKSKFE